MARRFSCWARPSAPPESFWQQRPKRGQTLARSQGPISERLKLSTLRACEPRPWLNIASCFRVQISTIHTTRHTAGKRILIERINDDDDPFARGVPSRTNRRYLDAKARREIQPRPRFACPQGRKLEPLGDGPLRPCQRLPPFRSLLPETLWRRARPGPAGEAPRHSESGSGPEPAG